MNIYKHEDEVENKNYNIVEDTEIYSPFDLDSPISFDLDLDFYYNNLNNENTHSNSYNSLNIVYFNEKQFNNLKTPMIGNIFEKIDNFNFTPTPNLYDNNNKENLEKSMVEQEIKPKKKRIYYKQKTIKELQNMTLLQFQNHFSYLKGKKYNNVFIKWLSANNSII